jgi:hypothetical protein
VPPDPEDNDQIGNLLTQVGFWNEFGI